MKDKDWGVKSFKLETPKYSVSCLICNKIIGVYDYPIANIKVCEDCKKAIAYVKELMENKENERI
jgi:hypothetical protein